MRCFRMMPALLALAGFATCATSVASDLVWYEEALQDDGSIVVVKKIESGRSFSRKEPGARTYGYRLPRLEVADPKTGKPILWYPRGLPPLLPYALHVHEQVPYVFAKPYLFDGHVGFGCPLPPYIVFRWEGDHWKRIALDQLPKRFKRHNLLDAAAHHLNEDGEWFYITNGRRVKARTITMFVRSVSGRPGNPAPRPSFLYQREIQYSDAGRVYECRQYNSPTKYDNVELR